MPPLKPCRHEDTAPVSGESCTYDQSSELEVALCHWKVNRLRVVNIRTGVERHHRQALLLDTRKNRS